jgi:F-type H+-transporting ATPase subunit delta
MASELKETVELFEQTPELARALRDPLLPPPRKKALLEAVFGRAKASPLLLRLLALLVDQGRFELLPAVEEAFRHLWNASRGVVEAEAVSADGLSEAQLDILAKALGGVSGQDVDLRASEDPSLIGGVLVKMAGKSYDGTVRGRLKALKARLAHGA